MKKIYSKITKERKSKYQIETSILVDGSKKIIQKKALSQNSVEHINRMFQYYINCDNKEMLCEAEQISNGKVNFKFYDGKTLAEYLVEALKSDNSITFEQLINQYKGIICRCFFNDKEKYDVIINKQVSNANIDLIFDNILLNNDSYIIIDYEWISDADVDLKFIVFRAAFGLYMEYNELIKKLYSKEEYFDLFSITNPDYLHYYEMNEQFNNEVYGDEESYASIISKYKKESIDVVEKSTSKQLFAQMYWDYGDGFNDENSLVSFINNSNVNICYEKVFDNTLKSIRLDLLNVPFICSDICIELVTNEGYIRVEDFVHNAIKDDQTYIFYGPDPQIIIYNKYGDILGINVSYKILESDIYGYDIAEKISDIVDVRNKELSEREYFKSDNNDLRHKILEIEKKLYEKEQQINTIEKDKVMYKAMQHELVKRLNEVAAENKKNKLNQ